MEILLFPRRAWEPGFDMQPSIEGTVGATTSQKPFYLTTEFTENTEEEKDNLFSVLSVNSVV